MASVLVVQDMPGPVLVVQPSTASYQSTADSAGACAGDELGDARRVHNGGDCSTAKGRYLLWRLMMEKQMQIGAAALHRPSAVIIMEIHLFGSSMEHNW